MCSFFIPKIEVKVKSLPIPVVWSFTLLGKTNHVALKGRVLSDHENYIKHFGTD